VAFLLTVDPSDVAFMFDIAGNWSSGKPLYDPVTVANHPTHVAGTISANTL
jgi:hypothetical protein